MLLLVTTCFVSKGIRDDLENIEAAAVLSRKVLFLESHFSDCNST